MNEGTKMNVKKLNEVKKHIEQLKAKGLLLTRANLADLMNITVSAYKYKYIDSEINDYITQVSIEQKNNALFKTFKGYVEQLVKEGKAITYENIAVLHGITGARANVLFQDSIYKEYMKKVKAENKILAANQSFKDFYSMHKPFKKFVNLTASEIFEKYGKEYFDTVQHFKVFCKNYDIPFKRVYKTKSEE